MSRQETPLPPSDERGISFKDGWPKGRPMSRENKFIWVMVAVIAIILAMALYGYLTGGWEAKAWWCPSHAAGSFYCTGK
jgi:hypothetical protein